MQKTKFEHIAADFNRNYLANENIIHKFYYF